MTEEHYAEIKMLKELLDKKCIKDKKSIYNDEKNDMIRENRKGVPKMKKSEKKVVCLTHTKTTHIIHLPTKWVQEMNIEKDSQIVLEFDGKKITVTKL